MTILSQIAVSTVNDTLVVDSRLVALELEIQHKNLFGTIKKYIEEIQEFGLLAFETEEIDGRGQPEKFCYLNEEQATYVMTLSRNTDQVRQCKRNLVKAFSEAKKLIKEVIPQQSERLRELQLENENLKMRVNISRDQVHLMDKSEAILTLHGAQMLALIQGRPEAVVEVREVVTETIVVKGGSNVDFTGRSTADIGKELGFKTGKELEKWLASIKRDDLVCQGLRAV